MPVTVVRVQREDDWAIVTLSSAGGLNKLGSGTLVPLLEEIGGILHSGCRCLGITGTGASFAVGADLREIGGLVSGTAREFSILGNSIFKILEESGTIVVAGVDGFCLGGGLDLALSADWRMATPRSVFGHPGADLGLITGFGGTQRLPRSIGRHRAMMLFYTAGRLGAREALEAGLIQEITDAEGFQDSLRMRVQDFARRPAGWLGAVKNGLRMASSRYG